MYLILTFLNLFLILSPDLGTGKSTFCSYTSRTYLYISVFIPDNSFFANLPTQNHDMPRNNRRAAPAAVAGPSQATRRAPGEAKPEAVQRFIDALKASIARHNGNVDMPQGITSQNIVIAGIMSDGVPAALSREKRKWIVDEYDFIDSTQEWAHGKIAAYLGRSAQACRLARLRLLKKAREETRSPAQQDTEVAQNDSLQNPPTIASAPSAPVNSSAATQRFDQLYRMPIRALASWRDFLPIPMEPATSTALDVQAAAVSNSAPASHVIMSESGLNILPSAAARVEQRLAPYQHALSVMEHDVGHHEAEDHGAEDDEVEEHDVD